MPRKDRTLVLDIGSTAVHMGEFEYPAAGGMILHGFASVEYDEAVNEANRTLVISTAIRKALSDGKFSDLKRTLVCVSGQAAFMRFVKLPPVTEEESRVRQIVEYEARQNVPFPMEEVIWDYQLISPEQGEDLEVMFAVIKNEIVESVIEAVSAVGLEVGLVDFAPAALYNAARANYIGENECAMLLDIGGRCTNLLFLDGTRFFARAIPIAGFSITQQIAKEFGINTDEAEILKRRHGFVALGGAYEEPESEVAATISKIVRNVMTRLHGEINRSINVYRAQQKGNKPTHLYLSGGSSIMEFTTHFFSEKLRMEVSYFNPFKIVMEGPNINKSELESVAHLLPEVVGTGLRDAVECPVEISLVTDSIRRQQGFSRKKPFLMAACVVWVLILLVLLVVSIKKRDMFRESTGNKKSEVLRLTDQRKKIQDAESEMTKYTDSYKKLARVFEDRYVWPNFYNALQLTKPQDVWISYITPVKAPSTGPKPRTEEAPSDESGGIFGAAAAADTGDTTEWFQIRGTCVELPERDEQQNLIRPIFTDEQIAAFKAQAEAEAAANPKKAVAPAPTGDAAADAAAAPAPLPFWGTNRVGASDKVLLVFLSSLQHSPYFSDKPEETRFLSYERNLRVTNVSNFTIQVRLRKPISMKR